MPWAAATICRVDQPAWPVFVRELHAFLGTAAPRFAADPGLVGERAARPYGGWRAGAWRAGRRSTGRLKEERRRGGAAADAHQRREPVLGDQAHERPPGLELRGDCRSDGERRHQAYSSPTSSMAYSFSTSAVICTSSTGARRMASTAPGAGRATARPRPAVTSSHVSGGTTRQGGARLEHVDGGSAEAAADVIGPTRPAGTPDVGCRQALPARILREDRGDACQKSLKPMTRLTAPLTTRSVLVMGSRSARYSA